jgi:hypothetical protein
MATAERFIRLSSSLMLLNIRLKPSPQSCTVNTLSWAALVRMYEDIEPVLNFSAHSDSTWKKHYGDGVVIPDMSVKVTIIHKVEKLLSFHIPQSSSTGEGFTFLFSQTLVLCFQPALYRLRGRSVTT